MDSQTAPPKTQGYSYLAARRTSQFWRCAVVFFHMHKGPVRCLKDDLIPPDLSSLVRGRVNEYLQQRLDNPAFHSRLFVNEEEQLLAGRL